MLRALKHAWRQHKQRREAEAQAECDRIIRRCSNPQVLAVLTYAAGRCPNPVRQAHRLADISAAFQGVMH